MSDKYEHNIFAFMEAKILWGKKVARGDWAFCSENRTIGIVKKILKRGKKRVAVIAMSRRGLTKEHTVPYESLYKTRPPYDAPYSEALQWEIPKRPPALSKLDANLKGEEFVSTYLWCDNVNQFVGGEKVCVRRRQLHSLFPECADCDLEYLVGRTDEERKELEDIRTKMIFNDPPAHPTDGSLIPAQTWISGDKQIGDRSGNPDRSSVWGMNTAAPIKPLPRKSRSKRPAPPKKVEAPDVSVSGLISREAERLKSGESKRRVKRAVKRSRPQEELIPKPKNVKKIKKIRKVKNTQ